MAKRANEAKKEKGGYKEKLNNKRPSKKPIDKQKEGGQGQNTALTIEFGKHVQVLREVEKLAEDQLRPVDLQIIFMVKKQLESSKEG